jgi:hypothetical protein
MYVEPGSGIRSQEAESLRTPRFPGRSASDGAAGSIEALGSHPTGFVACKKAYHRCEFIRHGEAPERDFLFPCFEQVLRDGFQHIGEDVSRRDGVAGDILRAKLFCE